MSVAELQQLISQKFNEKDLLNNLQNKLNFTETKLKNIKIADPANSAGDSYLSKIFRCVVDVTGKNIDNEDEAVTVHVIVKAFPTNIARKKTYRSADFFENEVNFYSRVWTVLDHFQKSKGVVVFQNIPTLLSSYSDGIQDYIALEDLKPKGFSNAPRCDGLNYDQTNFILKLFAKFHSLSFALKYQQPELFERTANILKETYFAEKFRGWYSKYQQTVLYPIVKDAVEKELPIIYLQKFEKLFENDFYGKLCQMCQDHGPFSVICQGDAWIPNFLFLEEGQSVKDIVLIDFQFARWTSLAAELMFFLYTCVENGELERSWDDFIQTYYVALEEALEKLGSRVGFSLESLREEIEKYAAFGIGMSMEAVTFSLIGDDQVMDLDNIQGEEAVPIDTIWQLKPFVDHEKRQRASFSVKFSVDKGFI